MALARTTVSIPIANSLNQKTDSKLLQPGKLAISKNTQFIKSGSIDKRSGFKTLPVQVSNPMPNPLPIAQGTCRSFGFGHDNQLMLQNNGAVYTYSQIQGSWAFKNHFVPIEINQLTAVANTKSQVSSDCGTVNGITVIAYEAESKQYGSAGSFLSQGAKIGYSVIEESTGSFLIKEGVISALTTASNPKVICFSGNIFIAYVEGANLKCASISLVDGSIQSNSTLRSDGAGIDDGYYRQSDWCVMTGTPLGEIALFMYVSSAGLKIGMMNSSGTVLSSPGIIATGINNPSSVSITSGFSIYGDSAVAPNRFYIAYFDGSSKTLKVSSWLFTTSAYTVNFPALTVYSPLSVYGRNLEWIKSIALITNPLDQTRVLLFADTDEYLAQNGATGIANRSYETKLYSGSFTVTGLIGDAITMLGAGLGMVSKPFAEPVRKTVYLPTTFDSDTQGSFVLVDFLRGNPSGGMNIAAKWTYGDAYGRTTTGVLGETRLISGNVWSFTGRVKSGISDPTADGGIFWRTGIKRFKLNLAPNYAGTSKLLAGSSHLTGGYLASYDGVSFNEHSFFFNPEIPIAAGDSAIFALTRMAVSSSTVAESTKIALRLPGSGFVFGGPNYIKFYTPSANYYVWFRMNGSGTDPAPSGFSSAGLVDVSTNADTNFSIVQKIAAAIAASGAPVGVITAVEKAAPYLLLYNNAVGSVSPVETPTVNNTTSSLVTGNYQYQIVWKWIDSAGRIYRSAPSIAVSVTNVANSPIALSVSCPPITNRDASKIVVEVYRTSNNGTVFRKISSLPLEGGTWSSSTIRIGFRDATPDTLQASGEPIYTTGGVLENYQIGAYKFSARFKGRLVVAGVDDPLSIYYSKSIVSGDPVSFASELFFQVDADNASITGLSVMDEKLIIFKSDKIYFVSGDPPNDLGTGSSLTSPVLIPSDVGCVDPNSVVLYPDGLLFKSGKGIYKLGRSMAVEYVGAAVEDLNSYTVSSAVLVSDKNEIRFTYQDYDQAVVYNYLLDIWAIWTNHQSDNAFSSSGVYTRVKNSGRVQQETPGLYQDSDLAVQNITREVELPWIKVKGVQDFQRIYEMSLLGEYKSDHTLSFTISYDYDTNPANAAVYSWATSTNLVGSQIGDQVYQAQIKPAIQKCQAIKVKLTENGAGQSATWSDLSLDVGVKVGLNKTKSDKSI